MSGIHVACNLCGTDSNEVVYTMPQAVRVVRCRKCGLSYLNPRPKEVRVKDSDSQMSDGEHGRRLAARSILRYLKNVRRGKYGKLLDFGWPAGILLDEARKQGWDAYGEQAQLPSNFFDAVVLTGVMDHAADPKSLLEEVRRILKPNGILCCEALNMDGHFSRLLKARRRAIQQGHLYYFSPKTLGRMLEAAGFFPLAVRAHDRGGQMRILARKSRALKFIHELEACEDHGQHSTKKKVVVVLPAYNAAKTLEKTIQDIPAGYVDELLLVDDCSKDNTVEVAEGLGLSVIRHAVNKGYGGNQKTCYEKALGIGADIVIMLHPDYQYDPLVIPQMIEPIAKGHADAVFGSRMMKGGALEGGMPLWKYNANILLTALENVVLGIYLTEYHSGFRAYSRKYLERINFKANSDGFVFDTEIIVQGVVKFMRFEEVPIRTRYFDEASSIKLWPSIIYGLNILKTMLKFMLHQKGIKFKQFE